MKVELGEVLSLVRNGASIKQMEGAGGYPITRIETISDKNVNRCRMGYANITDVSLYKNYILEDYDILMSHINSEKHLGKAALYRKQNDEKIIHGMNLLMLRVDKNVLLPEYAVKFFDSNNFKKQIFNITKKSVNQASFTVTSLKKIVIDLIPIEEQEKVVHIMNQVNNLLYSYKQQLEKLDLLVKSRFIEMFGIESEFDKWSCCVVSDVADVCVGVVIKPTQYYADKGIPAFRSLNIGKMYVNDSDWVYFTDEGHQKNQKSVVHKNDVLVVRSGAPGTACVVTGKYDGYNAVDIIIAHPDNGKVNSVFLAAFTNMPHGMNQIREKTGGAAQQHFNVGGYKSMRIIMPPMDLQNQFADFVIRTDKSKLAIKQSLEKLETLKKSLMQQYFG